MQTLGVVCETIEECWDNDAEARLPAGCAEEPFSSLINNLKLRESSADPLSDVSHETCVKVSVRL